MKNVVFVHDHKLKMIDNFYYSNGAFNDSVFMNYYSISNNLTLYLRVYNYENISSLGLTKITKFTNLINSNNLKLKPFIKMIMNHDLFIIRLPSINGLIVYFIAKFLKKKMLIEVVGCTWDSLWNHSLVAKFAAPFLWLLSRIVIFNSTNVLYVTKYFLQKRYPTKGLAVSCSDVLIFNVTSTDIDNRIQKIEYLKFNEIKIGTLASVNLKYKGHHTVFNAIKKLNTFGYYPKYYLAGSGSQNRLKRLAVRLGIINNVVFLGSLNRNNIVEFFNSIDLYIQPSLVEALPRALIEAMSLGLPCIGSNAGGIKELLSKEYIFKKNRYKELVEIIRSLNKKSLIKASRDNIVKSNDFNESNLSSIRKKFYNS